MPRTARIVLAGYPHHVVQRGHNRKTVFARERDYTRYLENLEELKEKYQVRVFAYCLMTNHVHLLLQPDEQASALGQLMKALAGRATRYRNMRQKRTGTLWEGRYRSSPVQSDQYLMACCRYIELNPVRAAMVEAPESYRWSSCRQHLGLCESRWIDLDPVYQGLGATDGERAARYRQLLGRQPSVETQRTIRQALQRGQLTGNAQFVDEVDATIGRRVTARGPGRPRTGGLDK